MLAFRVSAYGNSFATRQRARELVSELPGGSSLELDFSGVLAASPSFTDELVGEAAKRYETVSIAGLPQGLAGLFERVIERRGVGGRIRILALA